MLWVDYNIEQLGDSFKVQGEWEGEVMGIHKDGSEKPTALYRPGDVYIVNESGWLVKQDKFKEFMRYGSRFSSSD